MMDGVPCCVVVRVAPASAGVAEHHRHHSTCRLRFLRVFNRLTIQSRTQAELGAKHLAAKPARGHHHSGQGPCDILTKTFQMLQTVVSQSRLVCDASKRSGLSGQRQLGNCLELCCRITLCILLELWQRCSCNFSLRDFVDTCDSKDLAGSADKLSHGKAVLDCMLLGFACQRYHRDGSVYICVELGCLQERHPRA